MARHPVINVLIGLLLTACSPYVYNQEITSFSTGVDALMSSYQSGEQAVDTLVGQQRQAQYVAARSRLHLLDGCLQTDPNGDPPTLPACTVVPTSVTTAPPLTPHQRALIDAAPTFAALKTYADALTAVTNAADDATLTQATQSLTSAAGNLVKAVGNAAPPVAAAGPVLTQASSLIGLAITTYLDYRRYTALRDNVPAANTSIQTLSRTVQAALAAIRAAQLDQLRNDLLTGQMAFLQPSISKLSQAQYQAQLTSLLAKVTAFNQARAADPAATVKAMVTAHQQVADALKNGSGQAQAVLAAAQSFAAAATQLKTAIETVSGSKAP